MTQNLGRTWHVVTRLLMGDSKYQVRTPDATSSVLGTEFQVNVAIIDGSPETTVTTNEGRVAQSAPDPQRPGQTSEVLVGPGQQGSVRRGEAIAPPHITPPPGRSAVITIDAEGGLVVDAHGRANGVKDGKVVSQTPGAMVALVEGRVQVMLPDSDDGKLATHVEKRSSSGSTDVTVTVTVTERGGSSTTSEDKGKTDASGRGTGGVEVRKGGDGKTEIRKLGDDEKKSLPSGKVAKDGKVEITTATVVESDTSEKKSDEQKEQKKDEPKKDSDQATSGGQDQTGAGQKKDQQQQTGEEEKKDDGKKKDEKSGGGAPGAGGQRGSGAPRGGAPEPPRPNPPQEPPQQQPPQQQPPQQQPPQQQPPQQQPPQQQPPQPPSG